LQKIISEVQIMRGKGINYDMVITQVPNPHETPEAWIHWGHRPGPNDGGVIRLKDPSFISGFEIRYLEHHARYTDEEWGWDYDYVLDDRVLSVAR